MSIDYFTAPSKQILDLPQKHEEYQPICDAVYCYQFYKAVGVIAEKYSLDYLLTRAELVRMYEKQSTFSLYGICSHAIEGEGCVAEKLRSFSSINRSTNV
jgi:hypothetical protein